MTDSANPILRGLHYAFYDWTREMPKQRRVLVWTGILIQGYAIYAGFSRSLIWPLIWPTGPSLLASVWLLYVLGGTVINAMLTWELKRKTQLESDQIAARQIQQTLQPGYIEQFPGYQVETFYQPFRDVGGDYFDVIDLPGDRTLFALADVSGKGMPAALLSANIQALVRTIANVSPDPLTLARQISAHLNRYTPSDRYATAVFLILSHQSGELTYVNAGHNPPLLSAGDSVISLAATGLPLGLMRGSEYASGSTALPEGGSLLLFTDGLTDGISGDDPEGRLRAVMLGRPAEIMPRLKALLQPRLNQDDVTILLVRRLGRHP
jgi:serine phosphatase RsbU (regulator of sigma subunit)